MNRRVASAAFLVAACATVFAAPRQDLLQASQSAGTGSIAGVTVDESTGRPIGGVAVNLSFRVIERETWLERQATSDADGRFAFRDLPRGEANFRMRLDGWREAERVSEHPEEDEGRFMFPIDSRQALAAGQRIEDLRLGLRKFATLTGRVVDVSGAPIARATVSAMPYRAVAGRQQVVSGPDAKTDEQGVYQITTLTAGEYVLTASVGFTRMAEIGAAPGSGPFVFGRRFHPDVTSTASPQTVAINWGQTLEPIDFALRKGPAVRVSGQVTGAASFSAKPFVHLEWTEPLAREDHLFVAYSYLDPRGNFTMAPVPPGRYVLTTWGAQSASGRMLWTRQPVTVGAADITGLNVPVQYGRRVIGRVEFEGALPKPSDVEMARIFVVLSPPEEFGGGDIMPPHTTVGPNGTFTSAEMTGGRYIVNVWGQPQGWTLRSAIVAGKDAADTPVDLTNDMVGAVLTFTDRAPRLHGLVIDDKGQPAAGAHVLVFPTAESLWTDFGTARRLRWVTTGRDGTYELRAPPAGDYLIAAVSSVPQRGWRDAAYLKTLATSATRISLAEGGEVSQTIRVIPKSE